jgi:RNA polymerase-binding transcription factor DksA
MADDIDLANDLIDSEVSRALSKIRQNTAIEGSKFCVECGDNMPIGRTNLGFQFCVSCAEDAERKKSMFVDY